MVPEQEIILLNRKDDPPPVGAPISDDEISDDDSFSGSPHRNQREVSSMMLHQHLRKFHYHQRHLILLQREIQ